MLVLRGDLSFYMYTIILQPGMHDYGVFESARFKIRVVERRRKMDATIRRLLWELQTYKRGIEFGAVKEKFCFFFFDDPDTLNFTRTTNHSKHNKITLKPLNHVTNNKDGNFTHGYRYPRVPYPYGQGMGTVLYSWVVPIPYPLSHG
jgi:hypothetical protein